MLLGSSVLCQKSNCRKCRFNLLDALYNSSEYDVDKMNLFPLTYFFLTQLQMEKK